MTSQKIANINPPGSSKICSNIAKFDKIPMFPKIPELQKLLNSASVPCKTLTNFDKN